MSSFGDTSGRTGMSASPCPAPAPIRRAPCPTVCTGRFQISISSAGVCCGWPVPVAVPTRFSVRGVAGSQFGSADPSLWPRGVQALARRACPCCRRPVRSLSLQGRKPSIVPHSLCRRYDEASRIPFVIQGSFELVAGSAGVPQVVFVVLGGEAARALWLGYRPLARAASFVGDTRRHVHRQRATHVPRVTHRATRVVAKSLLLVSLRRLSRPGGSPPLRQLAHCAPCRSSITCRDALAVWAHR